MEPARGPNALGIPGVPTSKTMRCPTIGTTCGCLFSRGAGSLRRGHPTWSRSDKDRSIRSEPWHERRAHGYVILGQHCHPHPCRQMGLNEHPIGRTSGQDLGTRERRSNEGIGYVRSAIPIPDSDPRWRRPEPYPPSSPALGLRQAVVDVRRAIDLGGMSVIADTLVRL